MKYITAKESHAKQYQPLTPTEFLKGANLKDIEEVIAVLAGYIGGSFVMVSRDYKDELEIVVIEPKWAKPIEGQAIASDWYYTLKDVQDRVQRNSLQEILSAID